MSDQCLEKPGPARPRCSVLGKRCKRYKCANEEKADSPSHLSGASGIFGWISGRGLRIPSNELILLTCWRRRRPSNSANSLELLG
jgi:hypothetical protein